MIYYYEESASLFPRLRIVNNHSSNLTQNFQFFKPSKGCQFSNKIFASFGLIDDHECGTPWEVLDFHKLDGKSLAQRISGVEDIEAEEKIKQKYTEDASK